MAIGQGLERKLDDLRKKIRKLDSAVVAFSGGVDSSFLMRICREELGEKAVAVTALSDNYPSAELSMAKRVAKIIGVKHMVMDPAIAQAASQAPRSRRNNVYSSLKCLAMRMKVKNVLDGSHRDDAAERGASFMAAKRAGVRSPLLESNLTKAEIRLLARELGLPNWDKPPSSLAKKIRRASKNRTKDQKLAATAKSASKTKTGRADSHAAAEYLSALGYDVRVRAHGKTLLIFATKHSLLTLAEGLSSIEKKMKSFGFTEVSLKLAS
ncbi:MAG: 7-cyano-7-deazaguanine synthase [Candidatus ainarchaeum sp.]|nr:7-cyano-7-deazaguanine synthase [Candidatus ainarchaeum sp.]